MGRALRNEDPTVIYHAVSRGNNRGPIVWDGADRDSLCGELGRAATKFGWDVYAWCALSNHYHVVLRAPKGGLSLGFQQINGNHARRTNIRYGRVGHLFQNRFFAGTVSSTVHLVAAVLYVGRNPVAAGLCRNAAAWPDSSYRATAGLASAPDWLLVDRVLGLFGNERKEAQAAYARLVHHGHLPVSDTIEAVARVEPPPVGRESVTTG
jgi:REP element-mobilizing transposase RayT